VGVIAKTSRSLPSLGSDGRPRQAAGIGETQEGRSVGRREEVLSVKQISSDYKPMWRDCIWEEDKAVRLEGAIWEEGEDSGHIASKGSLGGGLRGHMSAFTETTESLQEKKESTL